MSVQRYTNEPFGSFAKCSRGEYVLHTDYAALEARCAGLERERAALKERVELGAQEGIKRAFDMLTYVSANTDDDAKSEFLHELAEDILADAKEYDVRWKDIGKLLQERDALQANLAAAEEALRWYANDDNYRYLDRDDLPILYDSGERARAALADTTTGEVQP